MALPALPLGLTAWRLAALAVVGYAAYQRGKSVAAQKDRLADLPDGIALAPTKEHPGITATARMRRRFHPSYILDIALAGRIHVRKA